MFRGGTADCKSVGLFYGWFDSSTTNAFRGLAERFIAPVLKTDMGNTIVRSNRTPSILRVSNSMAECLFSKQVVAGSSPVWLILAYCWIFQRTESLATNEEMKVRFLLQQPFRDCRQTGSRHQIFNLVIGVRVPAVPLFRLGGGIGRRNALKMRPFVGSTPTLDTFGFVLELAYRAVLETVICGFDSHRNHHLRLGDSGILVNPPVVPQTG